MKFLLFKSRIIFSTKIPFAKSQVTKILLKSRNIHLLSSNVFCLSTYLITLNLYLVILVCIYCILNYNNVVQVINLNTSVITIKYIINKHVNYGFKVVFYLYDISLSHTLFTSPQRNASPEGIMHFYACNFLVRQLDRCLNP